MYMHIARRSRLATSAAKRTGHPEIRAGATKEPNLGGQSLYYVSDTHENCISLVSPAVCGQAVASWASSGFERSPLTGVGLYRVVIAA